MTHPLAALIAGVPRFCNTSDALMAEDPMGAYVHWHDLIAALEAAPHVVEAKAVGKAADTIRALVALATAQAAQIAGLENEKILSKAAYDGISSLLLSVQQDCIAEHQRANKAEAEAATLRAEVERLREAINYLLTDVDDDLASAIIARVLSALEGKNDN